MHKYTFEHYRVASENYDTTLDKEQKEPTQMHAEPPKSKLKTNVIIAVWTL